MALFTVIGVIVVAFVLYAIFRGAVEQTSNQPPQKNSLNRQHSMSVLLTHHMCHERDLKDVIFKKLEVEDMSPDEVKNFASIFVSKAHKESSEKRIHFEDTQSYIIAQWLFEHWEKEDKELKEYQKKQSDKVVETPKEDIEPFKAEVLVRRDSEIYRRNLEHLCNTYKCTMNEVMDVYLRKSGATMATDQDLLEQIKKLQIAKEEVALGLGIHPDDSVFGILQNWSSQYLILRKQLQLERAKAEYQKRNNTKPKPQ